MIIAAYYLGVDIEAACHGRTKEASDAKSMAVALMHFCDGFSHKTIARMLGYADHTSVLHQRKRHREKLQTEPAYRTTYETVKNAYSGTPREERLHEGLAFGKRRP